MRLKPSKIYGSSVAVAAFIVALSFQNCAPVSFESAPAPSLAQAPSDASGSQDDSNSDSDRKDRDEDFRPLPEAPKFCIDSDGKMRADRSSWTITSERDEQIACPDGPTQIQKFRTVDSFHCYNGEVKSGGRASLPVNELSACPSATLSAHAAPPLVREGSKTSLNIESNYVSQVSYVCEDKSTGTKSGAAVAVGSVSVPLNVSTDLSCEVLAKNSKNETLSTRIEISVDCGNKLKEGGRCVEFSCKSLVPIERSASGILEIPARTGLGICYTLKIMDPISLSSSTLTSKIDTSVVSRDHKTTDATLTRNPYVLGQVNLDFLLAGPRTVKLSGAADATTKIKVDNFILSGIYPKTVQTPGLEFFRAYGTTDSAVLNRGGILLKDEVLAVQGFGATGTSSIAPVDITTQVHSGEVYSLDLRALDCGGTRELSPIYLVFQ